MLVEIPNWTYVKDERQAAKVMNQIARIPAIAVDTETTGLVRWRDRVLYWSMSDGHDRWCLPANLLSYFRKFLQDPARTLVFHNANYDSWMLANSGVDVLAHTTRRQHRRHCTMTAHTLYQDNAPSHSLKYAGPDLICNHYDLPPFEMPDFMTTFDPEIKAARKELRAAGRPATKNYVLGPAMMMAPLDKIAEYASLDAWVTYMLWLELQERLGEIAVPDRFGRIMGLSDGPWSLWDYYLNLEVPMLDVCYGMEREGSLIDQDYLEALRGPIEEEMEELSRGLNRVAKKVINPNSIPQLQWLFFEKDGPFKLKPMKMTSGGASGNRKASVDVNVLGKLKLREDGAGEAARIILDYRHKTKLLGTYVTGILDRLTPHDGRIRCTFTQHVTTTGRLSAVDPNLMNIPSRSEDGARIRRAFIPSPGKVMIVVDQSTLEPRITAGLSRDENACTAMLEGRDYHSHTASLMWGLDYDIIAAGAKKNTALVEFEQLPEHIIMKEIQEAADEGRAPRSVIDLMIAYRNTSKTMGLGLTYGEGAAKLAIQLGIKPEAAIAYLSTLYEAPYRWKLGGNSWLQFRAAPNMFMNNADQKTREIVIQIGRVTLAQSYVDKYWESYPGVRIFFDKCIAVTEHNGAITTVLGRVRRLPEIHASDHFLRFQAQRQAQNHPVQGHAAEVMKKIQINWYEDKLLEEAGVNQQLQVHDEIVSEVDPYLADDPEFSDYISDIMANPFPVHSLQLGGGKILPFTATPKFVPNWKEGK